MESGEVAVEQSCGIGAFGELKASKKYKDRVGYYPSQPAPHHYQHRRPRQPQYPAPLSNQHPMTQQFLPPYHQYANYGSPGTVTNYPPPPHATGRRGVKPLYPHDQRSMVSAPLPQQPPSSTSSDTAYGRPRDKGQSCVRFLTRGSCHYGANCKYSHDGGVTSSPSSFGHSKLSGETTRRHNWTNPTSNQHGEDRVETHMPDVHFPSLSGHNRKQSSSSRSNQSPERAHFPTSPKKLVFRDAVLKQQIKQARRNKTDPCSPSKSSNSSDSGSTDGLEDETASRRIRPRTATQRRPYRSGKSHVHPSNHQFRGDEDQRLSSGKAYLVYPIGGTRKSAPSYEYPEPPGVFDRRNGGYTAQSVYTASQEYGLDSTSQAFSHLSCQADKFVTYLESKLHSLRVRQDTAVSRLQEAVTTLWSDAAVEVYGSNSTRLALPTSDVDCVLVSQSVMSEEPALALRRLANEIHDLSWAKRVELLDSAKIPVLKVVYCPNVGSTEEVALDLTCSHSLGHSGLSARDLITSYEAEMPALRPLVLILKSHIQSTGLNCAFTGGLSSYALVLLVIRFLQACGDEHHKVGHRNSDSGLLLGQDTRASSSPLNGALCASSSLIDSVEEEVKTRWFYCFSRDGRVTWQTGLGDLLLLFLETYISFDYRRFGISIENAGEYFPLPTERVELTPAAVVSPYIADPITPGRNIGNCFRMHEVIQAWYVLYQQLAIGIHLDEALHPQSLHIGPL